MAVIVLVHGAWLGSWVWKKLIPLLEGNDYTIFAPDLPGLGQDETLLHKITFQSYVDCLIKLIENQNENVILVGHSMAGMVISAAAEKLPDRIFALVYLCAFLPKNGQSLMDLVNDRSNHHMELEFSGNFTLCKIKERNIKRAFFNECIEADLEIAKLLMKPQPLVAFNTSVNLSEGYFGKVPKIYIECTKDNAITIEQQREMIDSNVVHKVYSIDSDHSPFFSTPDLLSNILKDVASSYSKR
jgi:pimeloyl-ACP methyl ester carboxylesterase